jgi:mitochondrial fission protein ELM1
MSKGKESRGKNIAAANGAERREREVSAFARDDAPEQLRLVVIISDGEREHVNQSRGVAAWISKLTGAETQELEIPRLGGIRRREARNAAAKLLDGGRKAALEWISLADGEAAARVLGQWMLERGIREGRPGALMFISAGSTAAMYNLALGYIWRCASVTIMTPSVIGVDPFDFAIIPEHDYPNEAPNILTTVGVPNLIARDLLALAGRSLLREHPPMRDRRWGVLLGGDNKNYRVTAEWMRKVVGKIFHEAESSDIDLYIAANRKMPPDAESALKRMVSSCENVRFLFMTSSDPLNPVPAILGACDEIFVSDDSVAMVSEAATAGHRAVLLRAERAGAIKRRLQLATSMMVSSGLLPRRALWGAPRFDLTFDSFRTMGLVIDFKDWIHERRRGDLVSLPTPRGDADDFNEARRAAEWILGNLSSVECREEM